MPGNGSYVSWERSHRYQGPERSMVITPVAQAVQLVSDKAEPLAVLLTLMSTACFNLPVYGELLIMQDAVFEKVRCNDFSKEND